MPDSTPTSLLDQVNTLHGAVRQWSGHIPQNLPYIDLLFAFAFAELGEPAAANRLVEDARRAMQGPVPDLQRKHKDFDPTVAVVANNYLFKAFKYRIDQALAGQSCTGRLSRELLEDLDDLKRRGETGHPNNTDKLADYVIGRMRGYLTTLEPHDQFDPYAEWTKNQDPLKRELTDLTKIREPAELTERIRRLLADGVPGKSAAEVRFWVLREALPLAPRVDESFAVELLQLVPGTLAGVDGRSYRPST